jgi:hypothetical protein
VIRQVSRKRPLPTHASNRRDASASSARSLPARFGAAIPRIDAPAPRLTRLSPRHSGRHASRAGNGTTLAPLGGSRMVRTSAARRSSAAPFSGP